MEHDPVDGAPAVGERAGEMVLLGADGARVDQGHVAREELRHGVFLAERREHVEHGDGFKRQLVKFDARVHLHHGAEVALGKLVHVRAQALGERVEVLRRQGHAHSRLVPSEAREQVGRGFNRLEQVDGADRATRAPRFVAVDGEQKRRNAVGVHQAARDDALDAFVPPLARHDEGALAVIHLGSLVLGDLGKLRLDGAALIVDAFELRRELARFVEVVAHQKIERELRVAHATSRVQAGNEREAEVARRQRLAGRPRRAEQRGDAGAGARVHARKPFRHQGAVLPHHGHEVGHRPQRGEISVGTP